jgi:hypothetical protein
MLPRNLATHGVVRSEGRDGRQDAAAHRYCCAIALLEVSEFYQLAHWAITPQHFKEAVSPLIHCYFYYYCFINLH